MILAGPVYMQLQLEGMLVVFILKKEGDLEGISQGVHKFKALGSSPSTEEGGEGRREWKG